MLDALQTPLVTPWPEKPCSTRLGTVDLYNYEGLALEDTPAYFTLGWGEDYHGNAVRTATLEGVKFGPNMLTRDVLVAAFTEAEISRWEDRFGELA